MKNRTYQQVALKQHSQIDYQRSHQNQSVVLNSPFDSPSVKIFALIQIIYNQSVNYVPSSVASFLHEQLVNFEKALYQAGYPYRSIRFCQYCLAVCADNILINSHWGHANHWQSHQLTAHLHYQPTVNDQLHQMLDYLIVNDVDWYLLKFVYTCVVMMAHCPTQHPIKWSDYSYPLYQAVQKNCPQQATSWFINPIETDTPAYKFSFFKWPWVKIASSLTVVGLGYLSFIAIGQYEHLLNALSLLTVS